MSGSIRLFVPHDLTEGASVALSPEQAGQLGRVLRRRVGDGLLLFNGRDGEFAATLAALDRDAATAIVGARTRPQAVASDVWLLAAPIRRDLFELVAEKATELGAAALLPVATRRTQPGQLRAERLRAIATEAAEQCERLDVPVIHPQRPLPQVLAGWDPARTLFVAAERADAPALVRGQGPSALLIGPEGGFEPGELDAMRRLAFVRAITLGPRILRAETAAIAGLALLLAHPLPPHR